MEFQPRYDQSGYAFIPKIVLRVDDEPRSSEGITKKKDRVITESRKQN